MTRIISSVDALGSDMTSEEREMFNEMLTTWSSHVNRNNKLSDRYDGKVPVNDIGISVPPPIVSKLSRCSMMWSRQAVSRIADASVIEGFQFAGEAPAGILEALEANEVIDQYDETLPSQLQHGPSFWTVTKGDIGEPDVVISSYDAAHATAIYDYRHRRVLCGMTIVDVDPKHPDNPTAVNFYAPDGTIVECELVSGKWISRRLNNSTGRCALEVMRYMPDKKHPFGQTAITPAIVSLEEEANREAVRMILHSELFTSPTRWVMGADDDIFENGRWEAYLGSIFALSRDVNGQAPTTGQYSQSDMTPHISYIRQLANQFAAEASIPIHSLLYTEANPASAEAIEASRHDLVEKVQKLNRLNGHTLKNIAMLSMSIIQEKPVAELGELERSFSVKWKNPLHNTLAAAADAAQKTSASVPGFSNTRTYWRMMGYDDYAIDIIINEVNESVQRQIALNAALNAAVQS